MEEINIISHANLTRILHSTNHVDGLDFFFVLLIWITGWEREEERKEFFL